MYKLASCCLIVVGLLNPLLSLPITDSREVFLQLSAPDEDAQLTSGEPERASLLQLLLEMVGAERDDGLRKADSSTIFNPRRNLKKFQAFSGRDLNILLRHLLARTRKRSKKRVTPECFWKYCV